jgi:hypothetical protein
MSLPQVSAGHGSEHQFTSEPAGHHGEQQFTTKPAYQAAGKHDTSQQSII